MPLPFRYCISAFVDCCGVPRTVAISRVLVGPCPSRWDSTRKMRSERIFRVLSHLEGQGPTRTRDIATVLGTPQQSTNALMQYLKGKGIVCPRSTDHIAPYE